MTLRPHGQERTQSRVAQQQSAPQQRRDVGGEQDVSEERALHAHVRGDGTAEIARQQHRAQHRRSRNEIRHAHTTAESPRGQHDIRRVAELLRSVDDGLNLEKFGDAVEDEESHGQPADDSAGPERSPRTLVAGSMVPGNGLS